MQTLRRELRQRLQSALMNSDVYSAALANWIVNGASKEFVEKQTNALLDAQADATLSLRAFKTDEEKPQYMAAITASANKKMDAMLDQERQSIGRITYPKRESLPEPVRELMDGWVLATGMKPLSKDVFHWMSAMNDWMELGVQVADIAPAYEYAKDKFSVLTPHSLTNTLRARKAQPAKSNFEMPKDGSGFYA